MMRKGIRQQAIRDLMDWMTRMSPDVAVQWLKNPTFRRFIMRQTGLKEKDLQEIERWQEEMLAPERRIEEVIGQPQPQPQTEQSGGISTPSTYANIRCTDYGICPATKSDTFTASVSYSHSHFHLYDFHSCCIISEVM
jgi:hypothetical protein